MCACFFNGATGAITSVAAPHLFGFVESSSEVPTMGRRLEPQGEKTNYCYKFWS